MRKANKPNLNPNFNPKKLILISKQKGNKINEELMFIY